MSQAKRRKPIAAGDNGRKKTGPAPAGKAEKALNVLLLEDNPADAELIERQLRKAGISFACERVKTGAAFQRVLNKSGPDLILADYSLPRFNALQALDMRNHTSPFTPFIIITGTISEEIAVECMKQGADDYLLKDRLARLGEAIKHALQTRRLQSEKAEAEATLRQSERQFRDLYDNATIGMYRTTVNGRIVMANLSLATMLGYASFAELAARDLEKEGFGPEHPRRYFHEQMQKNGKVTGLESVWVRKDGTTIHVRESAVLAKAANGTYGYYDGTVEDISARKQAENSLHEMNEIFRLFLKHSPIYVFIKNENIRPVYLSANYEKMLGKPMGEILDKNMNDLFPSELSRSMIEDDKRILREGKPREFIEELGGRTYSTLKFPIFIQGKAKYLAGFTTDITERERIESELKESENRYRNHFENSSEFYFTLDLKGNFTDVNKAAVSLTGHAKSELLRMNFKDYTPKKDHKKLFLALANVYKTGEPLQNLLIEAVMKDKSIKYFETNFSLIKDGEQAVGFQGSSKDISERKRAEEQIQASLREKEVLLKEIHHRVKNNLQIISGLLTLQAEQLQDKRLEQLIKESQSRIWTMALIHQTLYQSGNLADIDMADYIRNLAGNLLSSHARIAMPPTALFDLLPLRLVIDKAIPLALIINELLTNALKHAFPDGRPGEIRITLHESKGKARGAPAYELTVADNGAGLPAGFDAKNQKSLGLQLVAMLTQQLGGTFAAANEAGAVFRVSFDADENK